MAVISSIIRHEDRDTGREVVSGVLSGATSTFVSKFGTIDAAIVDVEGTNSMTWTRSGSTITITGTQSDVVDIVIYGTG